MFNFQEANKLLQKDSDENNEINFLVTENNQMTEDEAIEKLKQSVDIQPLLDQATKYEVTTVENATQALSMALQARKLSTALLNSKKEILSPQMYVQHAVNKIVGDYRWKLEEIENNLKNKIEKWIDDKGELAYSAGLDSIKVEDGSLKRVNSWCFEIQCVDDIPFEFLCADVEAIERAIKGGIREIPGVKIYLKQEVKLRVKN